MRIVGTYREGLFLEWLIIGIVQYATCISHKIEEYNSCHP